MAKSLKITREWAMPSANTFSIDPIDKLLKRYCHLQKVIIDPFANTSKLGTIRNDLNPDYQTEYCMDALDFLKEAETESADIVLFDPPYSPRQVSEVYMGVGRETSMQDTQASFWSNCKDQISRIVKPQGLAISFGWNSMGMGKNRFFEIIEIMIVPHGGHKNDTIVTVERKFQGRLL
jgi:hypothetical protein